MATGWCNDVSFGILNGLLDNINQELSEYVWYIALQLKDIKTVDRVYEISRGFTTVKIKVFVLMKPSFWSFMSNVLLKITTSIFMIKDAGS